MAPDMIFNAVMSRTPLVIDPHRSLERAIYVTGSARSGTTWVAEVICAALGARLIFEPLHHNGPLPGLPHFTDPSASPPELTEGLRRALSGALNTRKVNLFQHGGWFSRRVVKDIRPGVLSAVRALHAQVPIILLLRHPLDVAVSKYDLENRPGNWWDTGGAVRELRRHADDPTRTLAPLAQRALEAIAHCPDPLAEYVAVWCVENALALGCFPDARGVAIRYEDLIAEADARFSEIATLIGVELAQDERYRRPSKTTFRTEAQIGVTGKWRHVMGEERAAQLLAMTEQFGLQELYGLDPKDHVRGPPIPTTYGGS